MTMLSLSTLVDDVYSYFFGRELRVGEAKVAEKTVEVPIEITPNGDEVAVSFTLEYDNNKLANPKIRLGEIAPDGSVLSVNTNEPGRVGILIDSTETMTASAIPQRLLVVTFEVIGEGVSAVSLTGSLAAMGISDAGGNSLSARYSNGKVDVHPK